LNTTPSAVSEFGIRRAITLGIATTAAPRLAMEGLRALPKRLKGIVDWVGGPGFFSWRIEFLRQLDAIGLSFFFS
jgi:hypothetical protein